MDLRKSLKCLNKFDWCLWLFSVLVVTISFVLSKDFNVLTLIASLVGVSALIFLAKGNVLGQILTILFSILYAAVSFQFHYYGEMITYLCMTMPTAMAAVVSWMRHPYSDTEVLVSHMNWKKFAVLIVLTIIVTILFYYLMKIWGTSNLLFSTLSIVTSFLASGLMVLRSPYYAIAYSGNDIVLIILWILATMESTSYLPMIFCFVMFLVNDIYGFVNWNRMKKSQMNGKERS